jgi:hypothetical protein
MSTVLYVRGYDNALDRVWQNAHPRGRRSRTTLHVFDYEDDEWREYRNWNGALPPRQPPDDVRPISGILDLYDFVKARPGGDVKELHFFTHGYEGGPLLHNNREAPATPLHLRDPADADPRIKDFSIATVLGGAEGRKWRAAFSRTALIKLWGCTHREDFRQQIKREFFGSTDVAARAATKRTYQDFIRDGTYQFALARLTGLTVYAAPLGWGTNPYLPFGVQGSAAATTRGVVRGVFPPRRGDQWWRVSEWFRPDRGHEFYTRELRARLDVLDYVAYTDAIVR